MKTITLSNNKVAQVTEYTTMAIATEVAKRKNAWIVLGDNTKVWVCSSNRHASRLAKAGYTVECPFSGKTL